jgi:H/ACA ribonucleoprotein complex subunit 3
MIAKGGEAEIYDLKNGQVAKIFKTADHPDYNGLLHEQQSAELRIQQHQQKLRTFPENLPSNCMTPQQLVTDKSGQQILGYTMNFIANSVPLAKYHDRLFRIKSGISNNHINQLFQKIYYLLEAVHNVGIVVGDFNDLNILVKDAEIYFIDTDSWQFDQFLCSVFSHQFIDPLLCDPKASSPILCDRYQQNSDWYSFSVLLFQCWLFVNPYGGIHRPKDISKKIANDRRSLARLTIFDPEVQYPKPAIPYQVLKAETTDYFKQIFQHDHRDKFPLQLLEISWQKCNQCGIEHQLDHCPICQKTIVSIPTLIQSNNLVVTQLFKTSGVILKAQIINNKLAYLYHDRDCFRREDHQELCKGQLSPSLSYAIYQRATVIGFYDQVLFLSSSTPPTQVFTRKFACNSEHYYWLNQNQLFRGYGLNSLLIGEVIGESAKFWVGEYFGFGFYLVGEILVSFTFSTERSGIKDSIKLPLWRGELIDANCIFAKDICWLFLEISYQGRLTKHLHIIDSQGNLILSTEVTDYPCSIHAPTAIFNYLYLPCDQGVIKYTLNGNQLQLQTQFSATAPYLTSTTQLLINDRGLYTIDTHAIHLLQWQ